MSSSIDSDETRLDTMDDAQAAPRTRYVETQDDDCVNILTNNDEYYRYMESMKSKEYFKELKRKQREQGLAGDSDDMMIHRPRVLKQ